jgi:branched-subunit amino acid aminotransferase/4-amino-4-deoxychorismate lyase
VRVPAWGLHLRRLAESLALLSGAAVDDEALDTAVHDSLRVALRAAGPGESEHMLVVHVSSSWRAGGSGLAVHLSTAPSSVGTCLPMSAAVLGPPRSQPGVKSSLWVAERRALEAVRPPDCGETLLANTYGALLEGVTSNFFAVVRPAGGGALQLHTAALVDGVLGGITRLLLLHAASELGLQVVEAAPLPPPPDAPPDGQVWVETFVCSAVRGVRPLSRLVWLPPLGAAPGEPPPRASLELPHAPGPVTVELTEALRRVWQDDSLPDLSA